MSEEQLIKIQPVDLNEAIIIEPYWTCSLEEGMISTELFTPRTVRSIQMFIQRISPLMNARRTINPSPPRPSENFFQPVEGYRTLNGDGLISICMKVHDKGRHHKIATYDHVTQELKTLGSIPRHRFEKSVDQSVFCMRDPQFVEGVIGAMTHDAQFVAIFAHSKRLCVVNVFNIPNAACLFEKDLTASEFFQDCQPTGIAIVPTNILKSQFDIGLLSDNMEVRVWNTSDCMGRAVKLQDAKPSFCVGPGIINPRSSFLRFSPDAQYLCVLVAKFVNETCEHYCIVLDAISLHPLYRMPHSFTYGKLSCIFPCFTVCGSSFTTFTPNEDFYDLDAYQLHFFEIPQTLQSLKDLCRLLILTVVDRSNLHKLPLPCELTLFLTGNHRNISISVNTQKNCCLM